MAKIAHIAPGTLRLIAQSSADLHQSVERITQSGYVVTDLEEEPIEYWYRATIQYLRLESVASIITVLA